MGVFISVDPKLVDWNTYAYCSNNPIIYIDQNGENPILVAMLLNGLASAAIDFGMQFFASGGDMDQMRWGSVGASFVSGALSTGAMGAIAKAGGALATNTFNAMLGRSLISNGIDLGVRSIGLAFDAKKNKLDYGKEFGRLALSSALNIGTDVVQGVGNKMRQNGWDPSFEDFKRRTNDYNNEWIRRWDPGSLNKGWEIAMPMDFLMTTTQRTSITFTMGELIYPSVPNRTEIRDNTIENITIPKPCECMSPNGDCLCP